MAELSEDLLNKLNIEGSLSAKEFAEMLLFDTQNDIDDLRRSFKKNFLDKFKNQLDNIKTQDIKRIFDPLGLSGLLRDPDSLRDEYKDYKNKLRKQLRKATENLNKKDDDDVNTKSTTPSTPEQPKQAPPELNENNTEVSPEIENDKKQTGEKNKNQNNIQEQRGLGKETSIIEFSENTNKFLSDLFGRYFELKEKTEKEKQIEKKPEEKGGSNSLLDLLGYIVTGGVLAAFWGDYIRPFLEEKFDFMDRLKGTFNALEKGIYTFFGKGLDIGVTVVKSVSEFATGLVKSVFNFLSGGGAATGKAAGAVIAEGGEAAGKKVLPGLLSKIGGKLLQGIRFVPLIGGIISLGFAYDRFINGDYFGSVIDLIGAIGSFITPVSGPIGAALSWGALAFNAFRDITKTDEDTKKEKQNADWLKNLPKTIGKALLNNPLVKSISNLGSGLFDWITGMLSGDSGKAVKGLKTLNESPLSSISSILLPLFDNSTYTENKTGNNKIDYVKFWSDGMKVFIKKLFPSWLYNLVAKTMGWNETSTQEFDIQKNESQFFDTSKPKTERYPAITKLNEETIKTKKEIENLDKEMTDFSFSKEVSLQKEKQLNDLKERLKLLEESNARIKGIENNDNGNEWPNTLKTKQSNPVTEVQDGEIDYTPKLKVGDNTIAKFSPNDQFKIMAAKPDGVFEQMNKNLMSNFEIMAKQFGELSKTLLSQQNTSNNSVVNINNAGGNNQNKFTITGSDPILRSRTSYIQSPLRMT